ncbi:FtsB family cell division protein [Vulgatibacter incomptus]|nr:septum formation initiator family protein [Vulgatibacter incomptus]
MNRSRAILLSVVAALAAVGLAVDPQGLRHARTLREDVARIEGENARLREANEKLRLELRRLADDPAALERAAREELGLVRPGDVVFRLEDHEDRAP